MLKINHTEQYAGTIEIDGQQVKSMTQSFNEDGIRNGAIGEYIVNKELYFANLQTCRQEEDEFLQKMRIIEDSRTVVIANETKK